MVGTELFRKSWFRASAACCCAVVLMVGVAGCPDLFPPVNPCDTAECGDGDLCTQDLCTDVDGEAVCDTDGDSGDGWEPDVVEFAGVVISVSEFGLVLRTDSDYVTLLHTADTVFEDADGEPISKDQVVLVVAGLLAVGSFSALAGSRAGQRLKRVPWSRSWRRFGSSHGTSVRVRS